MIKNIFYVGIALVVLLTASCDKWLELKPEDGLIREDFWKTKEQVAVAVNGIYASLLEDRLVTNLFAWGELRADMVAYTGFATIEELNLMRGNMLPSNALSHWGQLYFSINLCNTVIAFAPLVLENDPTFTQEQLAAYQAEAYAVRALLYFYLYRTFGEVPLQLTPTYNDAAIERKGKNTKEEVYAQIVSDLQWAEQHAPLSHGSIAKDKGRITRYAVHTLMADVFLWEDRFEEALAACDKVIDSRRFGLINAENQSMWFNTVFYEGNSNESIFEFQFHRGKLNPFFNALINANRRFTASELVMEEIYTYDLINIENYDRRGNGAAVRSSDMIIWKFAGASGGQQDMRIRTADESFAHWFVYRYPDVLLMKAEALAWLNRGAEALELVYQIRERAYALETTDLNPSPNSAEDIAYFILQERAREFAFEGKRWFDLLRYAKRNNYAGINTLLEAVLVNVEANSFNSVRNKFRDPNAHYLPVFVDELERDPYMEQNPFYR
ncbi:RagB/SusD family nutrient uptake outer membrane protein [Parapedobacter composti]|nr:RagB/SusD family nutrient uptake outer membrane protein [Parapedobacter composti]